MHSKFVLHLVALLVVLMYSIFFVPLTSYSQTLPSAHAFTPFTSASEFSSGRGYSLDSNGVLLYDYGSRYKNLGKFHNPTFIAAYANALYRDFLSGDKQAKEKFLQQVNYLIYHAKNDVTGVYWTYPFVNEHFLAPKNWYSAMTSGRILGLLVRAHALTQDNKYMVIAAKVFKKLSLKRELGGMMTYGKDGTAWLEEVAYPGSESFKVLNGHIFGLAGVYDYAQYIKSKEANNLLEKGIKAVENNLDSFDSGFLSYYSEKSPVKEDRLFAERGGYNVIHIQQLLWLYEITENADFLQKASSFQFYETNYPDISVSHSTNSETHGPEKMNLTFGTNYWSSYEFPVQIMLDLKQISFLRGIVILGHTLRSSPRDFFIESSIDHKNWKGLAKEIANRQLRKTILFTYLVEARYLRITVNSDNGNGAVALDGFGLLYEKNKSPVMNFSNYSVGLKKLIDSDKATGVEPRNDGWLLLDGDASYGELKIYGFFNVEEFDRHDFYISGSDDLNSWSKLDGAWLIKSNIVSFDLPQRKYKYYRISFLNKFMSKIDEIEFE